MQPQTASGTTEVRYCNAGGDEVTTSLERVEVCAVAAGELVREFSWRPKQGNYPGWWWSATMSAHVGYESLLERDRLMLADFDPGVTAVASQPFGLTGRDGDVVRRHVPDYLLVGPVGAPTVVDVKRAAGGSSGSTASIRFGTKAWAMTVAIITAKRASATEKWAGDRTSPPGA
jgi:hypothetical protein